MYQNIFKRYQVLLDDWQETYIRYICKKHHYSFSELIRFFLSVGFLYHTSLLSSKYESGISKKRLAAMIKRVAKHDCKAEERYKIISCIHFEARKAVEKRFSDIKKQNKKII